MSETVADHITATQALRLGKGLSVLDLATVLSPAGALVTLKTFRPEIPVPVGAGLHFIAGGRVANNVNAKTAQFEIFDIGVVLSVAVAVNTVNRWLFDVLAINVGGGFTKVHGKAWTGPDDGAPTAQAVVHADILLDLGVVRGDPSFLISASQVAAGDVIADLLYVSPIILPA